MPLNRRAERDLAIFEGREILGRGDVEVERARHGEVDDGAAGERRDDQARVRPEQPAQRLAPARRLAEEVEEPLLLGGLVAPAGRLDPDLAAQGDGGNRRFGCGSRR